MWDSSTKQRSGFRSESAVVAARRRQMPHPLPEVVQEDGRCTSLSRLLGPRLVTPRRVAVLRKAFCVLRVVPTVAGKVNHLYIILLFGRHPPERLWVARYAVSTASEDLGECPF